MLELANDIESKIIKPKFFPNIFKSIGILERNRIQNNFRNMNTLFKFQSDSKTSNFNYPIINKGHYNNPKSLLKSKSISMEYIKSNYIIKGVKYRRENQSPLFILDLKNNDHGRNHIFDPQLKSISSMNKRNRNESLKLNRKLKYTSIFYPNHINLEYPDNIKKSKKKDNYIINSKLNFNPNLKLRMKNSSFNFVNCSNIKIRYKYEDAFSNNEKKFHTIPLNTIFPTKRIIFHIPSPSNFRKISD